MSAVIIATIAVSAIPVAMAYKIATGDVKTIEASLHQKAGNATFIVEFFPKSHLQLVGDQFDVRITEHDGRCPPEKVAEYLQAILTREFQTPENPHAGVKVIVQQVQREYGNGKAKGGLEDGGTTYTVTVKNDQLVGKHPVLYCNGVHVDTSAPFLNTWFTSPAVTAQGISTVIQWTVQYSVSLCQVILKDGFTVTTQVTQPVNLGQQVIFSLKGGMPQVTPATDIANKNVIQVYLEPGYDYEGWAVGFGVSDPNGKDNPTMVVQADADVTYNFTPTPNYLVSLASEDNTNKLVQESEVTNAVPIKFNGTATSVTVEHQVDGTWNVAYPSKGVVVPNPQVALKLVKRTVTSTTIEEYA